MTPPRTESSRRVDARRAATADLLDALHARFGAAEFRAAEIADDPTLAPLLSACGSATGSAGSVGSVLARRADRPINGRMLLWRSAGAGILAWRVAALAGGQG